MNSRIETLLRRFLYTKQPYQLKRQSTARNEGINCTTSVCAPKPHRSAGIQLNRSESVPVVSTPIQMNIDMTLATSYKPILVCIAKVCALMIFHYASVPVLFVTERYAIILAVLYNDNWLAQEYIINTNSCTAVLAGSLLVHELRDAGIQERLHGDAAHTVILIILTVGNIFVLVFGEQQGIFHLLFPTTQSMSAMVPDSIPDTSIDTNNKRPRQQLGMNNIYGSQFSSNSIGPFLCVLSTSLLLVVLSTCAMPTSTHDPLLINIRVWSFTVLSLTWMYTVNYKDLRYSTVAPFTPCIIRFSCVLFLTPPPLAIAGVLLMSACLAGTHVWTTKHQPAQCDLFSSDHVHQGVHNDTVSVVVRDTKPSPSTGSVISYRATSTAPEKSEVTAVGAIPAPGLTQGIVKNLNSYSDLSEDRDKEHTAIPDNSIDYDSMFLQALSERDG
jgi:hypothetical protein